MKITMKDNVDEVRRGIYDQAIKEKEDWLKSPSHFDDNLSLLGAILFVLICNWLIWLFLKDDPLTPAWLIPFFIVVGVLVVVVEFVLVTREYLDDKRRVSASLEKQKPITPEEYEEYVGGHVPTNADQKARDELSDLRKFAKLQAESDRVKILRCADDSWVVFWGLWGAFCLLYTDEKENTVAVGFNRDIAHVKAAYEELVWENNQITYYAPEYKWEELPVQF